MPIYRTPPAEIPKLIAKFNEGYDVVGGWRRRREDNALRRAASLWMNRLVSRATGVSPRDYGCMLRIYSMDVVRLMRSCGETSSFIPALAHCFTDRMVEIPVGHAERKDGKSRYSLLKLVDLLLDLLTGFAGCYNPARLFATSFSWAQPNKLGYPDGREKDWSNAAPMEARAGTGAIVGQKEVDIGVEDDARTVLMKQVEATRSHC
jgi:glycosyltransferase involved in cell wall biosynthesis